MPTIMENWETHKPVAEEDRLGTAHEATDAREASARPEVASNPRIRALMAARDEAERKLQKAILDVETREQSPAFQKAEELFKEGIRLEMGLIEDGEVIKFYLFRQDDRADTLKTYDYSGNDWEQGILAPYGEEKDLLEDLNLHSYPVKTLQFLLDLTIEQSRLNSISVQQDH